MQLQSKTPISHLNDVERIHWDGRVDIPLEKPSILQFCENEFKFDFLFHPKKGTDKLFVLFSGDALRKKFDPPVFQRWTWADHFPGSCLYVSDPSLYLAKILGLAWYAGTDRFDLMETIAQRTRDIAQALGVMPNQIFSYGSSGGGFAAIRFLNFAPDATAIAINPQTDITKFEFASADRYLKMCFSGLNRAEALKLFPDRLSLIECADKLKDRKIIIAQNILDIHHYELHYKPFLDAMNTSYSDEYDTKNIIKLLFSDEKGHGAAENPDVFKRIIDIIS